MLKLLENKKFGVSLNDANCPKCGNAQLRVRKPKNFKQAMWGGYTCEICGLEMDKYGKEISK